MSGSSLGAPFQLGFVVRDIESAMRFWIDTMGVGPFTLMEEVRPRRCVYRGVETDAPIAVGYAYWGAMQVELIQQWNDAPSPYRDFLAAGREGLQHLAFYADDPVAADRQLRAGGMDMVYEIDTGEPHVIAYYEDRARPGSMTELVPMTDARARFHGALRADRDRWDGSDPIRRYPDIASYVAQIEPR